MTSVDPPLLRSLTGTAVRLPMKRALGTSAKSIDEACLVLVDLLTVDGVVGHAYRHLARIAQAVSTPIQIGENFTGLPPWPPRSRPMLPIS
ncbi:hypothetical protein [Bradyrhizobium altum]|uniref:hypothetical protein n=1 Tax=Bradyrhizobium altum TaxID=1571202 RepID=UPI001E31A976|nr:hypothetical protein [Bradyrhizobium altum]